MSEEERFKISVLSSEGKELGEVSASVARPTQYECAVILGHGAGKNMDSPLLIYMQRYLAEKAIAAVRFNFLYTETAILQSIYS